MARQTHRQRAAMLACLMWLAGFELLPWLHVAFHDEAAPHVHVGDMIITVTYGEASHRHADGTMHHPGSDRSKPSRDRTGIRLTHGGGSLAHHGVAARPSAPPLVTPLPIDRRPMILAVVGSLAPGSTTVPAAAARGPPLG